MSRSIVSSRGESVQYVHVSPRQDEDNQSAGRKREQLEEKMMKLGSMRTLWTGKVREHKNISKIGDEDGTKVMATDIHTQANIREKSQLRNEERPKLQSINAQWRKRNKKSEMKLKNKGEMTSTDKKKSKIRCIRRLLVNPGKFMKDQCKLIWEMLN